MIGCVDRRTGKVTIMSEGCSPKEAEAVLRALLRAANVAEAVKTRKANDKEA